MLHAVEHSLVVDDLGEDRTGGWSSDPTPPATCLNSSLTSAEGDEIIIHAMPRRPKYRWLLER